MKIIVDIHTEGGPIDASVALAKRAARKVRAQIRVLRKHLVKALAVPPPVLPKRPLKADEITA